MGAVGLSEPQRRARHRVRARACRRGGGEAGAPNPLGVDAGGAQASTRSGTKGSRAAEPELGLVRARRRARGGPQA
jgi:hypothetical protein